MSEQQLAVLGICSIWSCVAFPEMTKESLEAVFVLPDLMLAGEAAHISELALAHRLPTMTWAP